ncbi:MAG TPA: NAD-dependent epimerase/dehydratase family protein [Solirubrobacterales bacterium]|nr:NAD-dependent epimerase/dehydratase family protein [Solirubrobacterales bacterium]
MAASPRSVFITGALGLIGRRLAERYRAEGAEVRGMDVRADPAAGVVAGDLTVPGDWQDAAAGADCVIHTAAVVGMGRKPDAATWWRVNVLGTRHALDAAVRGDAQRFVHFSSIVTFGLDYPDGVDERYPLRPTGVPYVDTKVASEQAVFAAHAGGEVPCTIIRPGDVYGPGSHFWTVTPVREIKRRRLMLPAMGKGHVSPVYIDDLVQGVMLAAAAPEGVGQAFTLTGGAGVETRDYFGRYARMVGKDSVPVAPTPVVIAMAATLGRTSDEVTPDGVRYLARKGTYSIQKARSLLGYEPAVGLDEGMRRSQEWLRAEGFL